MRARPSLTAAFATVSLFLFAGPRTTLAGEFDLSNLDTFFKAPLYTTNSPNSKQGLENAMDSLAMDLDLDFEFDSAADAMETLESDEIVTYAESEVSALPQDPISVPENALPAAPVLCPRLSDSLLAHACNAGTLELKYGACRFAAKSGKAWGPLFNGNILLKFRVDAQSPSCPASLQDLQSKNYTVERTANPTLSMQFSSKALLVTEDNAPSGWDPAVAPKAAGGARVTFLKATGDRSFAVLGVHRVIQKVLDRVNTGQPGALHAIARDVTLSTAADHPLVMHRDPASKALVLSGTVILQDNLAKYTRTMALDKLKFDRAVCGQRPIGGSVSITDRGSKTDAKTLSFHGCQKVSQVSARRFSE